MEDLGGEIVGDVAVVARERLDRCRTIGFADQ
jgi:hypothetical protein